MIAARNDGTKSRKRSPIARHHSTIHENTSSSVRIPNRYLQRVALADLQRSVENYEIRFGLKSDRIREAIDRKTLTETHEVCMWLMDYERLRRATKAQERRRSARVEL